MQWFKVGSGTGAGSGPTIIIGPALDSAGAEYTGLVIGDVTLSKNGTEAALAANAALTHVSNGYYSLVLIGNNVDTLGRWKVRCNKSTYQFPVVEGMVLPATTYDTLVTNGTLASTTSGRTIVTDAAGLVDSCTVKLGPSGSGTAQTARDVGNALPASSPESITGVTPSLRSGTCQAGSTSSTIVLDAGASATNNFYAPCLVLITAGTGAGQGPRLMRIYTGSSQTGTVVPTWTTTPDNTSVFRLIPAGAVQVESWRASQPNILSSGRVDVSVGDIANNAITAASIASAALTAAKFASDAIDSNALAASAVSEMQSGLSTLTAAQANAEVDTALADIHLDHLLAVAAAGTECANSTYWARLVSKSATPAFSSFVNTTDSLEALRDNVGTTGAALTINWGQITNTSALVSFTNTAVAGVTNVSNILTGGITAGSFASDAIDSAALAASAVSEIQSGLSTLDAAGVRTAVGLASANLDTQLSGIPAAVLASTIETGVSFLQCLRAIGAAAGGKRSNSGTASEQFDALGNPGTARIIPNADAAGDGVPTLSL